MELSDSLSTLKQAFNDIGVELEWAKEAPLEVAGTLPDGRPFYFGIMRGQASLEIGRAYPNVADESLQQKLTAEFNRVARKAKTQKEAFQAMAEVADELALAEPEETGFYWQESLDDPDLAKGNVFDRAVARAFRTLHEQYCTNNP